MKVSGGSRLTEAVQQRDDGVDRGTDDVDDAGPPQLGFSEDLDEPEAGADETPPSTR